MTKMAKEIKEPTTNLLGSSRENTDNLLNC